MPEEPRKLTKAEQHQLQVMKLVHSLGNKKAIEILQLAVIYGYKMKMPGGQGRDEFYDMVSAQGDLSAQYADFRKAVARVIDGPDPLDAQIAREEAVENSQKLLEA